MFVVRVRIQHHYVGQERGTGSEIHSRMPVVYDEYSMSRALIFGWNKRYREGWVSLKDSSRPGHFHHITTSFVIAAIDRAVRKDRWWTMEYWEILGH